MALNKYDASASALGYIYQVRYALFAALKKMQEVDDPDLYYVSIEKLDDVAFDKEGTPKELLQTKYHGKPANLTDKSPDIWKTFRIWAEAFFKNEIKDDTLLYLITTESVKQDKLAYFLSLDDSKRDIGKALERAKEIILSKPSKENKEGYDAFNKLGDLQQKTLLQNIYVIDKVDDIEQLKTNLKNRLNISINKEYVNAFVQRLEGVWFDRVITSLNDENDRICLGELRNIMDDLREQFLPSNLPNDYSDHTLDELGFEGEERVFIEQIKLFTPNNRVLRIALENYYRAYAQKIRWQSEGLLKPNEVSKYYNRLYSEWDQYCATAELSLGDSEESKCKFAIDVYKFCQQEGAIPIRKMFDTPFVARGSYHQLADDLKIGWHPDFETKLKAANEDAA